MNTTYTEKVIAIVDQLEPVVRDVLHERAQMGDLPSTVEETAIMHSIAISLRRIADALTSVDLDTRLTLLGNNLLDIAYQAGQNFRGGK